MKKSLHAYAVMAITSILVIGALSPVQLAHAVNPGQCGSMDMVFIVDTTGSMTGELTNIKAGLPGLITQAQLASQGNTLRVGVISFDGFVVNRYAGGLINQDFVDVKLPLTTNQADWTAAINSLTLGAGGGFPEASDQAKATAIFNRVGSAAGVAYNDANGNPGLVIADPIKAPTGFSVPWAGQTNIAVLITDATSGGYDDVYSGGDSALVQSLGTSAGTHVPPIKMSDVFSGTDPSAITDLMRDASNSGGVFIQIPSDGSGLSAAIMQIIDTCGGEGNVIGGEILSIDTSALLVAGAGANALWLLPMLGVIAGTGAYFTRAKWLHKE